MRTTHKGGGECSAMASRRRPPRDMRGRGVSYHMAPGSLLLPSSSLCWPRSKRVVDRAQICCCLPRDLKPEMGPSKSVLPLLVPDSRIQSSLRGEDSNNFLLGIYSGTRVPS